MDRLDALEEEVRALKERVEALEHPAPEVQGSPFTSNFTDPVPSVRPGDITGTHMGFGVSRPEREREETDLDAERMDDEHG